MFLSLDPMAPLATSHQNQSPLEAALERNLMEIWNILKKRIKMTVELKLEQLQCMIVSAHWEEWKPHTEFKQLLSSIPVESVTSKDCSDGMQKITKGEIFPNDIDGRSPSDGHITPGKILITWTSFQPKQVAVQRDNKEAVLLLLKHGFVQTFLLLLGIESCQTGEGQM